MRLLLLAALFLHIGIAGAFTTTGNSDSALSERNWGDEADFALPPEGQPGSPADPAAKDPRRDAIDSYLVRSGPIVRFAPASVALDADALAAIAEHAERLKANRRTIVTLVAFSDETGSSSYGLALANRRAVAVANALIAMGAGPRQMRVKTYGQESAAIGPCPDDGAATTPAPPAGACDGGYRRVEFRYPRPPEANRRVSPANEEPPGKE